ncbi:MAG: histidine phosphatase family protein [Gordonia sp. (in: high G+C Gram-positive bacteria)]
MGTLYLVRHGQAPAHAYAYGPDGATAGAESAGPGLTDLGFAQARHTGRELARQVDGFDAAVSGGLPRQQDTLRSVLEAFDAPPEHVVDPGWDEYDIPQLFANPEDQAPSPAVTGLGADFQRVLDAALARWVDGELAADYSYADYVARIAASADAAADLAGPGEKVLVVSSAGTITALIAQLWGVPGAQWPVLARTMVNASITKIIVGRSGLTVVSINEHGHLAQLGDKLATFR